MLDHLVDNISKNNKKALSSGLKLCLKNLIHAHIAKDEESIVEWKKKSRDLIKKVSSPKTFKSQYDKAWKFLDKSIIFSKAAFAVGTIRDWKGRKYQKQINGTWKPVTVTSSEASETLRNPITHRVTTVKELSELKEELSERLNSHWERMKTLSDKGYDKEADSEHKKGMDIYNQIMRVSDTISSRDKHKDKEDIISEKRGKILAETEDDATNLKTAISRVTSRVNEIVADFSEIIVGQDKNIEFDQKIGLIKSSIQWIASKLEGSNPEMPSTTRALERKTRNLYNRIYAISTHLGESDSKRFTKEIVYKLRNTSRKI